MKFEVDLSKMLLFPESAYDHYLIGVISTKFGYELQFLESTDESKEIKFIKISMPEIVEFIERATII